MEFRNSHVFFTLLILLPLARCEDTGSLLFLDSSSHQYLRSQSSNDGVELSSMSLPEVGAAVSVLLGFVPPPSLSASGSSKLNEILTPNPFDRPRSVFMLEVKGIYDTEIVNQENGMSSSFLSRKVHIRPENADIQIPGEDEVSLVLLDEPLSDYTDEDIGEFASFIGGSYVADASKILNGELTVPLTDVNKINLHLSKMEDREFIASLLRLVHNIRRAIHIHEDLSQNVQRPAELISGSFNSIKALKDQFDSEGVVHQRSRLFIVTLSKIFNLLQEAYDGEIVGVIFFSGSSLPEADKRLNVMFTPRLAPRWLVEEVKLNTSIIEVALVRTTLAWITGIILLIATLMGEALLRLGFYCGEEDVEFSSFSSGTERAVKTWQAASGIPEDGIMTAELLEMLYTAKVGKSAESDEKTDQKGNIPTDKRDGLNGAVSSITEISEIQQKMVKGGANIEVSQQRVFLIGENRWEDPSRLHMPNGKAVDGKTKDTSTKCLACRGEGRLLCTECDGSGEPNIEPQFLEWIDEGTKCPYCSGLGYTTCDVCEGKTVS